MHILITGGAGFQGYYLSESLVENGHQVTVLSTYSDLSAENLRLLADKASVIWGSVTYPKIVERAVQGRTW